METSNSQPFHQGQRVVCIDGDAPPNKYFPTEGIFEKGDFATVKTLFFSTSNGR